jgi:hypothetical protein
MTGMPVGFAEGGIFSTRKSPLKNDLRYSNCRALGDQSDTWEIIIAGAIDQLV